jgi:hypothetical protein
VCQIEGEPVPPTAQRRQNGLSVWAMCIRLLAKGARHVIVQDKAQGGMPKQKAMTLR